MKKRSRKKNRCVICGKRLTDSLSLSRGIGPECWRRHRYKKARGRVPQLRSAPPTSSLSRAELEKKIQSQKYKWFHVWEQVQGYSYERKGKKITVPTYWKKTYVSIPGPDIEVQVKRIKGSDRLVEVFRYKGKIYTRILDDERKEQLILQTEDIKRSVGWKREVKTMSKEIPDNLVQGIKKIGNDPLEYSAMIDFEREYDQPERMAIVQGAPRETLRYPDFEMFGHTHPNIYFPYPSKQDLLNMRLLEPELIVAGRSGKTIILNIEDNERFQKWKQDAMNRASGHAIEEWEGKSITWISKNQVPVYGEYPYLRDKQGREEFFQKTGIRVYPYRKNTTIEMKDDPHFEKQMPKPDFYHAQKWKGESKSAPPAKKRNYRRRCITCGKMFNSDNTYTKRCEICEKNLVESMAKFGSGGGDPEGLLESERKPRKRG